MAVKLDVNGKDAGLAPLADTPLLWALRDELKLTGSCLDAVIDLMPSG